MNRERFLTVAAVIALAIGTLAYVLPSTLFVHLKYAAPNPLAGTMARTAGILLLSFSVLNFSVRRHPPSPTLRAIFVANIVVQVGIIPIDPIAWYAGTYGSIASFLPNTIAHLVLIAGFLRYMPKRLESGHRFT